VRRTEDRGRSAARPGVAKAGKATRERARGRACAPGRFDAHNSRWKTTSTMTPRLTEGGTPASSAWDGKTGKRVELALTGEHVHVCGCTGARVCAKACACTRQRQDRGGGQNGGGDRTSGQTKKRGKQEREGERAARAAEMVAATAKETS
jgi:hypothetical protein